MSSHFKRSLTTAAGTCLLLSGLLAGIAGCDNSDAQARDQVSDAIVQASIALDQLNIGSIAIGDAEAREQAYRTLATIVAANSAGGEMVPEQKQARQAIAAIAKLGLSEIELQRATDADLTAIRTTHELYGLIGSATQYGAKQRAAGSFDFTDTLREIEVEQTISVARKDELLLQAKSLERQLADLDGMIKVELGEYERLREESVIARDKAADAPLEDRQALIEGAAIISREADAHQVKAANAEAAYDLMVPQLAELRNRIAQTETELLSFENTRRQIQERKASLDREVAQNKADLQSTIGEIDAKFQALVTHQSEQLDPRYSSGLDLAQEAVSALGSARTGKSNLPRLKLVHAQQLLGQLHWQRAQSLQRFAQLVECLADNADLLQRGGEDAALLEELRSQIDHARQAAAGAFEEAIQAAESASLTPETLTLLHELKARTTGEEYVPPVEEQPESEVVSDVVDVAETTGTPADCINAIRERINRDQLAAALDYVKLDAAQADSLGQILAATDRLNTASVGRFDQTFYGMLKDSDFWSRVGTMFPGGGMGGNLSDVYDVYIDSFLNFDASTLEFQYDRSRTTAWASSDDPVFGGVEFVYENDQWMLNFAELDISGGAMADMTPEMKAKAEELGRQAMGPVTAAAVAAINDTTQRVENDEYGDEWSMMSAFIGTLFSRVTEANAPFQQQFMNQMGGGGMGGG